MAAFAATHLAIEDSFQSMVFLGLFVVAAVLKVRVPGIIGTYSPVFFFVLLGSHLLSLSEVVIAAGLAGIVQCTVNVLRRPSFMQVGFNAANMMLSAASAFAFIHRQIAMLAGQPLVIRLLLGASVYYFVNTALVSTVITVVEAKPLKSIWRNWCLGSLPYYVVGALIAGATITSQNQLTISVVLLVCPPILLATVYYQYWLRAEVRSR